MQNEVEHLKKAGSETPVGISQQLANAGIVEHQESNGMAEIDNSHGGLLSSSKAAVPAPTEYGSLVTLPEPAKQQQEGKPMEDTTWGVIPMARKLREKLLRRQGKGVLPNAA